MLSYPPSKVTFHLLPVYITISNCQLPAYRKAFCKFFSRHDYGRWCCIVGIGGITMTWLYYLQEEGAMGTAEWVAIGSVACWMPIFALLFWQTYRHHKRIMSRHAKRNRHC